MVNGQLHNLIQGEAETDGGIAVKLPMAALTPPRRSGNGDALVDSSSGVTLRTASGQLSAPYTLLDAIVGGAHACSL
jgi:hypothetical protein